MTKNDTQLSLSSFESLWARYPSHRKLGRKAALRHFLASYREDPNCVPRIERALNNYLQFVRIEKKEAQFIQNGSTWFNNWEDWVDWVRPTTWASQPHPIAAATMRAIDEDKRKMDEEERLFERDLAAARGSSNFGGIENEAKRRLPARGGKFAGSLLLPALIVEVWREGNI